MQVTRLHILRDRYRLLAHLASSVWQFDMFGPVTLTVGTRTVPCRYVAFGNVVGEPVLELVPISDDVDLDALDSEIAGADADVSVERQE